VTIKKILIIAGISWLFLFIFSLVNFSFLGGLSLPLFLFFPSLYIEFYGKFFGFLITPLVLSLCLFSLITFGLFYFKLLEKIYIKTFWINLLFWIIIISTFEIYSALQIEMGAEKLKIKTNKTIECFYRNSFLHSLNIAGKELQFDAHSVIVIDNTPYLWSYREQSFYSLPPTIYRNINLGKCRKFIHSPPLTR